MARRHVAERGWTCVDFCQQRFLSGNGGSCSGTVKNRRAEGQGKTNSGMCAYSRCKRCCWGVAAMMLKLDMKGEDILNEIESCCDVIGVYGPEEISKPTAPVSTTCQIRKICVGCML
jgi:hypothetical protein